MNLKDYTHSRSLPAGGLSRARDILPFLPFRRATLWNMSRAGTFPKPVKISNRITAWRNSEVIQWLDNQTADTSDEVCNTDSNVKEVRP